MDEISSSRRIGSVEKAFKIIHTLKDLGGAGVTELSEHLDMTKSTCHIYLQTLAELGYLETENGRYEVGLKFLELGGYARYHSTLYDVGRPKVDELSKETNDVVALGVENQGERVVLYRAEGEKAVHSFYSRIAWTGAHLPLNWTAIGKSILSTKSDEEIAAHIDRNGLPAATEYTITEEEQLFDEIGRVREQGYSLEDQEHEIGSRAVAAPIIGPNGSSAAISVTGPKNRISDSRIEETLADLIIEYADIISLELNER